MLRLYTLLVPIALVLIGGATIGLELGWSAMHTLGMVFILNAFVVQLHWILDMVAGIYKKLYHPDLP